VSACLQVGLIEHLRRVIDEDAVARLDPCWRRGRDDEDCPVEAKKRLQVGGAVFGIPKFARVVRQDELA
jgi:hypothetical protein